MESPAKKRSIFGFSGLGLWRGSTGPPADSNASPSTTKTSESLPPPPRFESSNASAHESPVKRASDTQLASRKMLGRPQGPSSKLSQSFSAADFDRSSSAAANMMPSSTVTGFPTRRKPGDNPYKTPAPYSSSTVSFPPPMSTYKANNFSGSTSAPRNIFRSSALYQRPSLPAFEPRVPRTNLTQSFPPNTPGKPPRGSTPDVSGRGMAQTTSSELFEMRIASPPSHLTGEALAKQVPENASRTGSIYADEYLAHLCPPDLDEHQRRQFFCILDMRRLKYAANEVFVKKDWKLNVTNFAKEYEKSRSLIMLRYGLYEFKTVRASEAVKKEWREKHGIASSGDESEAASLVKPGVVGSKRKAEDDLKSTENTAAASSTNANKRARAPEPPAPAPMKTKRKADAEPDESQPSKLHKPSSTPQKTPSATKSVFESIAKKSQMSSTPAKPPAKNNLFAPAPAQKLTNGDSGRSVFDTIAKASAPAPATNIFGHLSDASKGSPNDDADAESETSSGEEEEEGSEVQEASASDDASRATSGGAPTPQFGTGQTPVTVNGTSSASSSSGEAAQGRSLFDRITKGPDGEPIKVLPQASASPFSASASDKEKSVTPPKDAAPTPAPTNNTWNTNSPIKFSSGSNSFLGAPTPIPAATSSIDFAAKKPEAAPAAQNLFGAPTKTTESAPIFGEAKASPATSLFAKPAGTPSAGTSFGTPAASTPGASLFGSATPAFGQTKNKEETKESSATPAPASSLFSSTTPATSAAETPKPSVFQSSTLFGAQPKQEAASSQTSLFGKPSATETPAAAPPSANLFGQGSAKPAFGATPAPPFGSADAAPAKSPLFGSTETKNAVPAFGFGSTPAPASSESKPLFGAASSSTPADAKPIFGSTPAPVDAKPIFGSTPAPPSTSTPNIFSATPASQSEAAKPLFGSTLTSQPEAPKTIFGSTTPAAPPPSSNIFSFGSTTAPSQQSASQQSGAGSIFGTGGGPSFSFSAGGAAAGPTGGNPFAAPGTTSAPPSFNFGSDAGSQPSTSFTFGANTPAPTISFGGATQESNSQSNSQPGMGLFGGSATPIFSFGAGPSQPNGSMFSQQPPSNTGSIFGNSLAPGGGTSTGTNSPFTFGGASSLATTPAAGTPEPAAQPEENRGTNADGDEEKQEQISLTSGGPGEEDESVVHEIRAKALKLVTADDSDDESGSAKDNKSPWRTQGVGPLRVLRHKTTGAVRMLLRAEPRGHVALNKLVLPTFSYKCEPAGGKYVKLTTASDDGKGLETWMLQVKTPAAAAALAKVLEDNKRANEKK